MPPTLISFAIAPIKAGEVLTPEFKAAGKPVYLFRGGNADERKAAWEEFHSLCRSGKVKAAWAVEHSLAEAVMKMSFGNNIGFQAGVDAVDWYTAMPGAIVAELSEESNSDWAVRIGETTQVPFIALPGEAVSVEELLTLNDGVLEKVYPTTAGQGGSAQAITWDKGCAAVCTHKAASPKVVIPVFPGTNCEYDSARACRSAGLTPEILVVRNLSAASLEDSAKALEKAIRDAQIVFLPGGFSGGDEPEGSAKFIASFLRSPRLTDAIHDLLQNRDGLMLGICNGFQALIKLGLVPYGEIRTMDDSCPTLTYNTIGRHQSSIVRTRVCTNKSPWLMEAELGGIYSVPISHGEGRFLASEEMLRKLKDNGQIATQYVDLNGVPSLDTAFNPNGSLWAIEGITSPDGRVLGKMGHSERVGKDLYRNVPGNYDLGLFRSAARYFK